jgi:hypothetical protein
VSKIILVVFNGDPMCFIHVLLNSLDMAERGAGGRIIIEGAAAKLVPQLERKDFPLNELWEKVKAGDLIEGVCRACAKKTGVLEDVQEMNLPLLSYIAGHPSLARYRQEGYEIITF